MGLSPVRAAYYRALGYGRIAHPLGAELGKHARGHAEAAAERADVLAEEHYVGVLTHPDTHALADALCISHHRHLSRTSSTMSE